MITIKLLSTQIGTYWELIKTSVMAANEMDQKDSKNYLIDLLHQLLSDKAQCWFRIDDKRMVTSVLITKIVINKISNEKHLFLQSFYSFQTTSVELFQELQSLLMQFAEKEQCSRIFFISSDNEAFKIAKSFGYLETGRNFAWECKKK